MTTLRLAHRGDWRRAAENTLPALLAALEIPGCDGVEFDVRAAADGVPVLYHDETLERVHGVTARVDDLTADELADHGIPTLEKVLVTLPRGAFLDVELKGDPGRAAIDVLTAGRGPRLERAVVSSFEAATLERVGRLAPGWPRWLNVEDLADRTLALAERIECRGVSVDWRAIDARSVARARAAGLEVAAWTVRRRPTYQRLESLGVVAICAEAAALDGSAAA
jgi:glycerophosphoryl diester phosphodiesterase